jgi:hypothetical protein
MTKLDPVQGQSLKEWEEVGLLATLLIRLQQIGQEEAQVCLNKQYIKQYTKIGFPENSGFKEPKHVSPAHWAVIHITPNSKEVVAGYLEDDVFFIVFLDMDHQFWPTDIQSRGKNRR